MDPMYAQKLGVNIDELLLSQPDTGAGFRNREHGNEVVRVDIIVIDSVAALVPKLRLKGHG